MTAAPQRNNYSFLNRRKRRNPINVVPDYVRSMLSFHSVKMSLVIHLESPEESDDEDLNGSEFGITKQDSTTLNESGHTVIVTFKYAGSQINVELTALTSRELEAFKEFIDIACANAQPICELRDRIAESEYEQGNDSFARIYRGVPKIFVREGVKWTNYPILRRGFEWFTTVGSYITNDRFITGNGGGILERNSGKSISGHYSKEGGLF